MKKKFHFKENKMSFIYYVLILMLSYTGPVYAGLEVEKEFEIVEEDVADDIQHALYRDWPDE